MSNIKFFKDKENSFKCNIQVQGANLKNTFSRLLLETETSGNLYFNGKIDENGKCTFKLPPLKNIEDANGKLKIEVVADSTYFKVYENQVKFEESIKIQFNYDVEDKQEIDEDFRPKVSFELDNISEDAVEEVEEEKIIEKKKPELIKFSEFMK